MRRQLLTLSLTLWGLVPETGAAEVIDLGAGTSDLRVQSAVLDFGTDLPTRGAGTKPTQDFLTLASGPGHSNKQGPTGSAEMERLVLGVGAEYLRDPALRSAGLSGTEWLALFRANIAVESGFNPSARSPVGAIGLGQLMPETAAALGVDPTDPEANLRGSARYLLAQLATFRSPDLALAAYNAGPEAVTEYGGIPPYAETQGHVAKVLALASSTLIPE